MTKVILGVLGLEVASGWGEPSYHVSLKVDHLVPEEIFLVSLFFPSADSLYHRAEWQRHLKSQTGEISFPKARSLGDRCYQTPKRQFSRSGCLPLLLPPAKFWDRIYSFWELSCETTSGSEKIYLFVIWGWGEHRIWSLLLLASGGSESAKYRLWDKVQRQERKGKTYYSPLHQLAPGDFQPVIRGTLYLPHLPLKRCVGPDVDKSS